MSVTATAHLNFRGDAQEALTFYQSVFGGQLMMATYSQVGVPQDSADSDKAVFAPVDPSSPDAEHLAFGMLAAENGFRLAAYDVFGASGGGLAAACGRANAVDQRQRAAARRLLGNRPQKLERFGAVAVDRAA